MTDLSAATIAYWIYDVYQLQSYYCAVYCTLLYYQQQCPEYEGWEEEGLGVDSTMIGPTVTAITVLVISRGVIIISMMAAEGFVRSSWVLITSGAISIGPHQASI